MPSKPQPQPTPADEAVERARQAQALLDHPLLADAFEKIENAYTQAIINSEYGQVENRERAFRMILAIRELNAQLNEVVNNGKVNARRVSSTVSGQKK